MTLHEKLHLCERHHIVLCDSLTDAILDELCIPASDSGDYHHVAEDECYLCNEEKTK